MPEMRQPGLQEPPEQNLPAVEPPQAVPSALLVQLVVDEVGSQYWQTLAAFAAPLLTNAPPIQHPVWQFPALQTWPEPQAAPLPPAVQEVVVTVA